MKTTSRGDAPPAARPDRSPSAPRRLRRRYPSPWSGWPDWADVPVERLDLDSFDEHGLPVAKQEGEEDVD